MPKYIYAWNTHSESARNLKDAMGIRKIKNENSRFIGRPNKIVINWGSSQLPEEVLKCRVINRPELVSICSNKLTFFRHLSQNQQASEYLPPWTESFEEALTWLANGNIVCARTVLQGHGAEGLILLTPDNPNGFIRARLYTKYIKKSEEYRVHIVNGEVIDVQRKVLSQQKRDSGEEINWQIRNHANGFIYQRNNIQPNEKVFDAAKTVVQSVGLDFGAVDVIWNSAQSKPYVLEINTAPGITGTTVSNYAEAFDKL